MNAAALGGWVRGSGNFFVTKTQQL